MAKQYPWTGIGFETGASIQDDQQGQQAVAYWVRRATDPAGLYGYVAKRLRRQSEDDRRALFFNEVVAMRGLDHPGVANLVETNAEQYRDRSVQLFLITEAIDGRDLEEAVNSETVSFDDAVRITLGVLDILRHCHARGVLHRDIKPCHVILRDNLPTDPVLIDYGLAYNHEFQPKGAETRVGERRGNEFLIGPEHGSANPSINRTGVTDICQCLGLLFFALTGQYPRNLVDGENKKPHVRHAAELSNLKLEDWKRTRLLQIFEVGFELELSRRWPTIDGLAKRLELLLSESEVTASDFDFEVESIVRVAATRSHTARFKDAQKMAAELGAEVQSIVNRISTQITDGSLKIAFQQHESFAETVAAWDINMSNGISPGSTKGIRLAVKYLGGGQVEVVVTPYNGNLTIFNGKFEYPIGSYDLGFAEFSDDVCSSLKPVLQCCLSESLGVD